VAGGRAGLVRWAGPKQPRRAVEKAVRAYGRDPGRLLDLCRQAIVFATLDDLAACLRAILDDQACRASHPFKVLWLYRPTLYHHPSASVPLPPA
jgi:hypothetical protein